MSPQERYQVGAFAALTGVSVRALHHYDRIGLLRPSGRSESGYRLYAETDLLRLQQILTLRYFGFRLAEIAALLGQPDYDLLGSIRRQRQALRDRIAELERIDAALDALVARRQASGTWDWQLAVHASATVQRGLTERGATMPAFNTPEEMRRQFDEVARAAGPEEIARIEAAWPPLLAEIRANYDLDPASPAARALADRWDALHAETMAHFQSRPALTEWIGEGYRTGRYAEVKGAPQPEDVAFIDRVNAARR